MRKTKTEKGITLIALIITIVVLLILAVVAINSITNDGILSKAENATNKYNQAANAEKDMLDYYEGYLAGTLWQQDGTTVTKKNEDGTTITLEVGQTVTGYDAGVSSYTGGWAVLGAENGKLLLVSKENVEEIVYLGGRTGGTFNGKECIAGYNNGIEKLNEMCQAYLNSSLADEARSIKVEDINRVTGYDPKNTGDGKIYKEGSFNQYGNVVTYTLNEDGNVVSTSKVATGEMASGTSTQTTFNHVDGRVLTTSNSIDVESNYYSYCPNTLTAISTGTTKGITTTSDAYKILFKKVNREEYDMYWLASPAASALNGGAYFRMMCVGKGMIGSYKMWNSVSLEVWSDLGAGVRAVIALRNRS